MVRNYLIFALIGLSLIQQIRIIETENKLETEKQLVESIATEAEFILSK